MPVLVSDLKFQNDQVSESRGLYCITTPDLKAQRLYKIGLTGNFLRRFNQYRRCGLQTPKTAIIVEALITDFKMPLDKAEKHMKSNFKDFIQQNFDTEANTEWIQVYVPKKLFDMLEETAKELKARLWKDFESELYTPKAKRSKEIAEVKSQRGTVVTVKKKGQSKPENVELLDVIDTKAYKKFFEEVRKKFDNVDLIV
jgi:hypothetical protein